MLGKGVETDSALELPERYQALLTVLFQLEEIQARLLASHTAWHFVLS